MFFSKYRYILIFLFFCFLFSSARAELLLLEKNKEGFYQAVDYATSLQKEELDTIFKDILLKYQWPMITLYFSDFLQEEQEEYLQELEKDHGVLYFINKKLEKNYKDTYKVIFIPQTIFELAAINSFAEDIVSSLSPAKGEEGKKSIFPITDLRNGNYAFNKFARELETKIFEGLKLYGKDENAPLKTIKYAFEGYNFNPAIKDIYFKTTKYLIDKYELKTLENINGNNIKFILKDLLENFLKIKPKFLEHLESKEEALFRRFRDIEHSYSYFRLDDLDLLVKAALAEYTAAEKNKFLLFRGTGGFELSKETTTPLIEANNTNSLIEENNISLPEKEQNRGKQVAIDTPSQEILETYHQLKNETPTSFHKILPIQPTEKKSSWDVSNPNMFTPTSFSYANSLLAGTFYETDSYAGARSLDFMRAKKWGYALSFFIRDYLVSNNNDLPLSQKYFISPFHSITGLLTKGEFFHSRSKISLIMTGKEWSEKYKGIESSGFIKNILQEDRGNRIGFLILPHVDWRKLSTAITEDIGQHLIWIKNLDPQEQKLLFDTQKNISYFTFMEIDAFKKHFSKFQPVLNQIKEETKLKAAKERLLNTEVPNRSEEEKKIISKITSQKLTSPFEKSITLSLPGDLRLYNPKNVFWEIIQNAKNNITEKLKFNSPYTLAFDDIRKRTKEHILLIPKGPYISLPHFSDVATSEEIVDFFRTIASVAEKNKLDQTGYRIITNHALRPGTVENNNAYQEVPHFHIHLAGGECLGKPVAGFINSSEQKKVAFNNVVSELTKTLNNVKNLKANEEDKYEDKYQLNYLDKLGEKINNSIIPSITKLDIPKLLSPLNPSDYGSHASVDMDISAPPYGFGLSKEQFLQNAFANKISEYTFNVSEKETRRLIAYRIPAGHIKVQDYIGFILLNQSGESVYQSIHDFAKNASEEELINTLKFINDVAKAIGLYTSGFRLIADHGIDAWHFPKDILHITIAGGNPLGVTVTNAWGNRRKTEKFEGWQKNTVYDYKDLLDARHDHCPVSPGDYVSFIKEIGDKFEIDLNNQEDYNEYNKEIKNMGDIFESFPFNIQMMKEKLKEFTLEPINHAHSTNFIKTFEFFMNQFIKSENILREIYPSIENGGAKTFEEAQQIQEKLKEARYPIDDLKGYLNDVSRYSDEKKFVDWTSIKEDLDFSFFKHQSDYSSYKWIFLELDGILTKGENSIEPIEKKLINTIKMLIKSGFKVIALTNRYYWEDMDSDLNDKSHKDTFNLLKQLNLAFSNPENLPPFNLISDKNEDSKYLPKFKDGVIFCANKKKDLCLTEYLGALAKKQGDFPQEILFYDHDKERTWDIYFALKKLEIPGVVYWYNPTN